MILKILIFFDPKLNLCKSDAYIFMQQSSKNLEVDRKTITRWFLGVGQYPDQITAFFEVPYDY
ncbi:hypothetical protein ENC20_03685 [Acinetobacter indicus]|nr:hypothetical protein ENC20_03685 [Acinetobacter indicus]